MNERLLQELQKNNIISTEHARSLGVSKSLLSYYVKEGELERIKQGIYSLPDEIVDDMYTLLLRSEKIIFSHETALFLNDLSERTPFIHSSTIPSNASIPKSIKNNCLWYYIKPELHLLGMIYIKTTFGNIVRCYNPERTICDILRSRSRIDKEIVLSAIKNYVLSDEKNLNLLSEYAEKFKVDKLLKKYLEVLL